MRASGAANREPQHRSSAARPHPLTRSRYLLGRQKSGPAFSSGRFFPQPGPEDRAGARTLVLADAHLAGSIAGADVAAHAAVVVVRHAIDAPGRALGESRLTLALRVDTVLRGRIASVGARAAVREVRGNVFTAPAAVE